MSSDINIRAANELGGAESKHGAMTTHREPINALRVLQLDYTVGWRSICIRAESPEQFRCLCAAPSHLSQSNFLQASDFYWKAQICFGTHRMRRVVWTELNYSRS